jgi:hypothetical protein
MSTGEDDENTPDELSPEELENIVGAPDRRRRNPVAMLQTSVTSLQRVAAGLNVLLGRQLALFHRVEHALATGGYTCEHAAEIEHLHGLLGAARGPLLEHEKGDDCQNFMAAEEEGDAPHCWVCKLRDETDPFPARVAQSPPAEEAPLHE